MMSRILQRASFPFVKLLHFLLPVGKSRCLRRKQDIRELRAIGLGLCQAEEVSAAAGITDPSRSDL